MAKILGEEHHEPLFIIASDFFTQHQPEGTFKIKIEELPNDILLRI